MRDTVAQSSVMHRRRGHIHLHSDISTEKSALESCQVNVEATLWNHLTGLFVPLISLPDNAFVVLSCSQAGHHVGNIHSRVEATAGFEQNRLTNPRVQVRFEVKYSLTYHMYCLKNYIFHKHLLMLFVLSSFCNYTEGMWCKFLDLKLTSSYFIATYKES